MDIIFIGAGASKGARNIVPYSPPLGFELYQRLEQFYPQFKEIRQTLDISDTRDFEKIMYTIAESGSFNFIVLNAMIASYFAQFRTRPNNTFQALFKQVNATSKDFVFSTLNYDCLLELGICSLGEQITYLPETKEDEIQILKLHGSCNSFFSSVTGPLGSMSAPMTNGVIDAPVSFIDDLNKVNKTLSNCPFGPCMSFYMNNKPTIVGAKFLESLQNKWKTLVLDAEHILIIGVGPNFSDSHIWDPILSSNGKVGYVAGKRSFTTLNEKISNLEHVSTSFSNSISKISDFLSS